MSTQDFLARSAFNDLANSIEQALSDTEGFRDEAENFADLARRGIRLVPPGVVADLSSFPSNPEGGDAVLVDSEDQIYFFDSDSSTWKDSKIIGSAIFANIQGDPSDNSALQTALDGKAGLSTENTFQERQNFDDRIFVKGAPIGNGEAGNTSMRYGLETLDNITTGTQNVAIGHRSQRDNITGDENVSIGVDTLRANEEGRRNVAIGASTARGLTGSNNVMFGRFAGNNTAGDFNVGVGDLALFDISSGSNNIAIGSAAGRSSSPFEVTSQNDRIVMGNNDHTDAYIRISWTVTSDKRDKTNFSEVPYGLQFVNKLNPVKFEFRKDRDSHESDGRQRIGFLAQDVLELEGDEPLIVDNEDPNNLKLHESYIVPTLVNAIQELTNEVEKLKTEIKDIKQ